MPFKFSPRGRYHVVPNEAQDFKVRVALSNSFGQGYGSIRAPCTHSALTRHSPGTHSALTRHSLGTHSALTRHSLIISPPAGYGSVAFTRRVFQRPRLTHQYRIKPA